MVPLSLGGSICLKSCSNRHEAIFYFITLLNSPTNSDAKFVLALTPLLLIAAVAYGYLLPLASIPSNPEQLSTLTSARIAAPANDDQSALDGLEVSFPVHWRHQFKDTQTLWYEFDLEGDALHQMTASEPFLGVYVWRVNQTIDVWFNGVQVGSGGSNDVRHWNSPLYFKIPVSLIEDANQLRIRHYASHGWGSMEKPIIGSDTALEPIYQTRYFVQHDVSLGLFVFVVVTGLFCLAVWYCGRREATYLWFAIASIGTAVYCANQFVRYPWLSPDMWRWLTNISTDLWAGAIVMIILKDLKLVKPWLEKMTFAYLGLGVCVYLIASYLALYDLNIYFHLGSILLTATVTYLAAMEYRKTRNSRAAFYSVVIAIGILAGVHDTLMQAVINNGWSWWGPAFEYRFNLLQFTAPAGFLLIGINLLQKFIESLNSVDRLNAELEQRVRDAKNELEDNYQLMQEVLIKQAAGAERERIYRDLHDDVGSKLLSLYYRLEDENNSTLAKSALEDLRDIVSPRALADCDLSEAISQWRAEALSRTQDAGVELQWFSPPAQCQQPLGESQHAQLRRMLREVLSNAILHNSGVTEIEVRLEVSEGHLKIWVANDGVELSSDQWKQGRGLSNLKLRARELRGQFSIEDQPGRVVVHWSVPLNNQTETL